MSLRDIHRVLEVMAWFHSQAEHLLPAVDKHADDDHYDYEDDDNVNNEEGDGGGNSGGDGGGEGGGELMVTLTFADILLLSLT